MKRPLKQKAKRPKPIFTNSLKAYGKRKTIDKKLSDIKVCDPAIGSGAFPVGMMSGS